MASDMSFVDEAVAGAAARVVEDEEQGEDDEVLAGGVDEGQGYRFSRPCRWGRCRRPRRGAPHGALRVVVSLDVQGGGEVRRRGLCRRRGQGADGG